ncbi:hypothetical protein [Stieleria varia]|uniref:hypothetical protein n=1 Tax=Stieleria varia TaxID=2528005 RepID=UPI0011B7B582|nr:hypothetical protein [Stieleria varia]
MTWPLWVPLPSQYPNIALLPWWHWQSTAGLALQWSALAGLASSGTLVALGVFKRFHAGLWWTVMGCLIALMLTDQHRIQPWAYQSILYAGLFATLGHRRDPSAKSWFVVITASIYFYSSLGKFDYQFLHTVGDEFLSVSTAPLGGLPDTWRPWRTTLVAMMPATEMTIALLVLFPRTRRVGGMAAMGLHATLILILGPWSLNHSLGVLTWNVLLIIQAYLLMVRRPTQAHDEAHTGSGPRKNSGVWQVRVLVLAALIAPIGERWGYWDHWPSWALYSPHNSRVDAEIHRSKLRELDDSLANCVQEDGDGDGWHELKLSQWSLDQRGAPIYPQARYQLALLANLAERYEWGTGVRCKRRGVSDRWTGVRDESLHMGQREIQSALKRYWLVPSG